jgi:hypothetical protein
MHVFTRTPEHLEFLFLIHTIMDILRSILFIDVASRTQARRSGSIISSHTRSSELWIFTDASIYSAETGAVFKKHKDVNLVETLGEITEEHNDHVR